MLAHLYKEMCNVTEYINKYIGGYMILLHLWARNRFLVLQPSLPPYLDPKLELYPIQPSLGFRFHYVEHFTYHVYTYYIYLPMTTMIA